VTEVKLTTSTPFFRTYVHMCRPVDASLALELMDGPEAVAKVF
jgi:hypothetical protein